MSAVGVMGATEFADLVSRERGVRRVLDGLPSERRLLLLRRLCDDAAEDVLRGGRPGKPAAPAGGDGLADAAAVLVAAMPPPHEEHRAWAAACLAVFAEYAHEDEPGDCWLRVVATLKTAYGPGGGGRVSADQLADALAGCHAGEACDGRRGPAPAPPVPLAAAGAPR